MDAGIGEIATAVSIASTVAATASAAGSAIARANADKYNAEVAQNNAQAAQDQATYNNTLKQMQLEKTIGTERAAAGASGVSGGSLNNVEYNSLVMGKFDQLATTYEGKIGAIRNEDEAGLDTMGAQTALTSGVLSAAGTAIGGASKTYSQAQISAGYGAQPDFEGGY